jgi:hypothetical protein
LLLDVSKEFVGLLVNGGRYQRVLLSFLIVNHLKTSWMYLETMQRMLSLLDHYPPLNLEHIIKP